MVKKYNLSPREGVNQVSRDDEPKSTAFEGRDGCILAIIIRILMLISTSKRILNPKSKETSSSK